MTNCITSHYRCGQIYVSLTTKAQEQNQTLPKHERLQRGENINNWKIRVRQQFCITLFIYSSVLSFYINHF